VKVLLLGAGGQVGRELMRALAPIAKVTALRRTEADFSDPSALAARLAGIPADFIINAAAWTAVDRAEAEPALAHMVNAEAVAVLAERARETGAWLLHYSTDYVFDGHANEAYREDDPPNPLGAYGRSKRAGEEALAASGCRYLCLRTSWIYAAHGNNFLRSMLRIARTRDALRVVDDQFGAPTGADLVADVTAHLLVTLRRLGLSGEKLAGLYHLTAGGSTSWFDYACFLLAEAESAGMLLRVPAAAVEPITTAEYAAAAPRPASSLLDTTRLRETFHLELPDWQPGVARTVRLIAECCP
jgi:dTDP-4-dehydrorhamnose reductase